MEAETRQSALCPACGLWAPELACGEGIVILEKSFHKHYGMLLYDLSGLEPSERDKIMAEYSRGTAQCLYVVGLKLSTWQQIPLLLVGIANRDPAKASEAASRALVQFRETSDYSRHHPQTLEVLRDNRDAAEAIEKVSRGASARTFPALRKFIIRRPTNCLLSGFIVWVLCWPRMPRTIQVHMCHIPSGVQRLSDGVCPNMHLHALR